MSIRLQNEILLDKQVDKDGVLALCALQAVYGQCQAEFLASGRFLAGCVLGQAPPPAMVLAAERGIQNLVTAGHLTLVWQQGQSYALRHGGKAEGYFVLAELEAIRAILTSSGRNQQGALRYYLVLLTTISNVRQGSAHRPVGFRSIQELAAISGLSYSTVIRYTEKLEALQLLYVHRSPDYYLKRDGSIQGIANTYGRYEHRALVIEAGAAHRSRYGETKKRFRPDASARRSCAQKYHAWLRGKQYSYEELNGMYLVLRDMNEQNREEWPDRCKDLTPFKEFDFYMP